MGSKFGSSQAECECPTFCQVFQNFENQRANQKKHCYRIVKKAYNLKLRNVVGINCAQCKSIYYCQNSVIIVGIQGTPKTMIICLDCYITHFILYIIDKQKNY